MSTALDYEERWPSDDWWAPVPNTDTETDIDQHMDGGLDQ